ncbi:DUF3445 domain-containing protein [Rhodobacteraceae bacterium 2CG4]|uniref:DUF3445 domain-containing protein n=1 Tax=Halovulum marinum TaxID=2662447 RepID=A0A6L5Z1L9_9RHOB|nr:DUF3445 domain-containing protein [Halovulum marinum]MSU90451.1 DUF3445 domain-containing protein [Halovulum marinum]
MADAADAADVADVTVSPAPYLPFADPHRGSPPGLFALPAADWTEADSAFAAQMALRDRLIASQPRRVALALPQAGPALAELIAALAAHLSCQPGYARAGDLLRRPDRQRLRLAPTAQVLGRLAQEDWLILQQPDPASEAVLTAGAVCFPAHWCLAGKIGKPLTQVHDPVPGYADALAARVNRIFAALHPARPLQRLNWSLASDAQLHCPTAHARRDGETPAFLRVERQTLRRLPASGAIAFGIKTYLTPLADLPAAARTALAERVAALPDEMAGYKGGRGYLSALR